MAAPVILTTKDRSWSELPGTQAGLLLLLASHRSFVMI